MILNYFKSALRNLVKNKTFSIINILGLAIGMASFIMIMLWVQDELSYERYHKNADRICRVIWDIDGTQIPATPGPFAAWLKETIPGIEKTSRVNQTNGKLTYNLKKVSASARYVEPVFFEIFSFSFIKGDPKTALSETKSIILTESVARGLFGAEDPMGKTVFSDDNHPLKVTGILKDIPDQTHPYLKESGCFLSIDVLRAWRNPDSWEGSQDYKTYVLLEKGVTAQSVTEKINVEFKKMLEKYQPETAAKIKLTFMLQPLTEIRLFSHFKFDGPNGNIQYVIFFTLIAFFILIIACINFMNLTTAHSLKRTREIGLRKVVGANRFQLIKQFLGESIIVTMISFLFALMLVYLILPVFIQITGKELSLHVLDFKVFGGLISILLLTGIISGSYPALFLSSVSPIAILKEGTASGRNSRSPLLRRFLVIGQFTISIVLIIGTIIVYRQLDYMKNKNLGFDKENLIYLKADDFGGKYESIRNELMEHPEIINVSASGDMPLNIGTNTVAEWEGKRPDEKYISFPTLYVTEDFAGTFKLAMAEGRFFSKEFTTDRINGVVVNEAAVRAMGMKNPVGKKIGKNENERVIIGVVKDFHFRSLRTEVEPLLLSMYGFRHLHVRINSADIGKTIELVKNTYIKYYPDQEAEIHFFDDEIDKLYQSEKNMGRIFLYFSLLAIFVSCLGLFGLISFIAENKTKEIGVRKVLGASTVNVVAMLIKEFSVWVLLANIIAWPVAYYAMRQWLQDFAYRIEIGWWVFVLSGGIALMIALLTVSYQAVKAAIANPVDALRYE
jgi:putative ABC transport system permease protein